MQVAKIHYILDTNVLLHDPGAIFNFSQHHVVIPVSVLEEVDKFKRDLSHLGKNAREVGLILDKYRKKGSLVRGVEMENGGVIEVTLAAPLSPEVFPLENSRMNLIIAAAFKVAGREEVEKCIFVTKDVNRRIIADAMGIHTEDYSDLEDEVGKVSPGLITHFESSAYIRGLQKNGSKKPPSSLKSNDVFPNLFVLLRSEENKNMNLLTKYDQDTETLRMLPKLEDCWGIRPHNMEQRCALHLLLDPDIKLVTIDGISGTGKTLLAISSGLGQVASSNIYQKLLVSRPIFPLGKDIGYLPGNISEKLDPWMQPIYDNLDLLMGGRLKRNAEKSYQELLDLGILAVEPLTYIRGRNIAGQYLIIDEAQNLTPHEIKTIVTRAGHNTKIILTGDPNQIDNPYVDPINNGLSYVSARFRDQQISGHITLVKGERSQLADLAATLL